MPYNPGVQDISGQLLGDGIGKGGQALAAGLEKYLERKKKENDNAKYTDALFKNNPELQQAAGVSYEDLRGMSARDKIATGMAAIAKVHEGQTSQEAAQRKELHGSQMDFYKQRTAAMQQEQDQRGAMPGFIGDMQQMSHGGGAPTLEQLQAYESGGAEGAMPGAPKANLLQAFLGAAAKNPRAVDPRMMMQYLGDQVREDTAQAHENARLNKLMLPPEYLEDPATGYRSLRVGNTVLPTGINPGKLTQPEELKDADGNPTGMFAVRDRNGIKLTKGMSAAAQGKLDAGTIAQLHAAKAKALERVSNYRSALAEYTKDPKGYLKSGGLRPEPSELQDAQTDLEQINAQLRGVGPGTAKGPASAGESKAGAAGGGDAAGVREMFKAGKITKEEALKRLRGMGMK